MSSVASPASVITDLPPIVQVDPADQVGVALRPLEAGEVLTVEGTPLPVLDPIATGHKIALAPIAAGDDVRRYGWPIGRATQAIPAGAHVHSHNVATKLVGQEPYRYEPAPSNPPLQGEGNHRQGGGGVSPVAMSSNLTSGDTPPSGLRPATSPPREGTDARHRFHGFVRADGSVGTRNQIWVIPTVGCVGRTAQRVAMAAAKSAGVEDVLAFAHPFGCSQLGDDLDGTARVLAALACHPNAGGVLLLGLGCEENQLSALLERLPPERRDRVRSVGAQLSADEYGDAARAIAELGEIAGADRRTAVGLEALRLGLKCGGSDGFSGLTANPLIGRAADAVTAAGGTAILTEIPEMFGAERLLMARAQDRATFDRLVTLVDGFKQYFLDHGEPISENPSPGNVEGGITTLEEKSLGAVQKGGRATVTDVLGYGERVRRPGLVVLEAPGNDAVSTTALAAAGATLTLFSTGRGTPLGSPVPTMKLATNHGLAARKPGWIDFDAGAVLDDGLDATAEALLTRICAVASGEPARNEINEEREIALWKRGVTL